MTTNIWIIRLVLTLALLFGVYTETGIWTALAIALIGAGIEIASFSYRKMLLAYSQGIDSVNNLTKLLEDTLAAKNALVPEGSIEPKHFSPEVVDYVIQHVRQTFIQNARRSFLKK
jgi:hypothetical protein